MGSWTYVSNLLNEPPEAQPQGQEVLPLCQWVTLARPAPAVGGAYQRSGGSCCWLGDGGFVTAPWTRRRSASETGWNSDMLSAIGAAKPEF